MNILELGWEFPPVMSGGLGTACRGICTGLLELNHQITFLMPAAPKLDQERLEILDAGSVSVQHTLPAMENMPIESPLSPYLNETSYQEMIQQIEKTPPIYHRFQGGYGAHLNDEVLRFAEVAASLAQQRTFDAIHAHDWMTFPAALAIKKQSSVPLILHVHATEFDRSPKSPHQSIREIECQGLQQADAVIAVSHRTKKMIMEHYAIPEQRIHVAHNAVSKDNQLQRDTVKRQVPEQIVLYLGRVTGQKGPEYFVEAAKKVLDRMSGVRFVMAGSGDLLQSMIERVAGHRMQSSFHFTGFLKGPEVERMFALSDLYVMPSVSEPFGITPFEAMLFHVPIIVSRQSGIAEVLSHAPKVDYWDVDGMADWMVRILSDKDLAKKLVDEGAQELDQVSWLNTAKIIDRVMSDLAR